MPQGPQGLRLSSSVARCRRPCQPASCQTTDSPWTGGLNRNRYWLGKTCTMRFLAGAAAGPAQRLVIHISTLPNPISDIPLVLASWESKGTLPHPLACLHRLESIIGPAPHTGNRQRAGGPRGTASHAEALPRVFHCGDPATALRCALNADRLLLCSLLGSCSGLCRGQVYACLKVGPCDDYKYMPP